MDDQRSAGDYAAALVGFTVTQCIVDYAFALLLVRPQEAGPDQQDALLTIETPFTCTLQGEEVRCDPETDPRGLGPALILLWRTVESAHIADDGSLSLTLSDDGSLFAPTHPEFESWQLHTPEKALLIAMPGGEIAVFPPAHDEAPGA